MELITPKLPRDLVEDINKNYPENCYGCEHFRVIPDSKTDICVINEKPCKVDALNPKLTNPACKFAAAKSPFAYDTVLDLKGGLSREEPKEPQ
jgi:hypothetical protein